MSARDFGSDTTRDYLVADPPGAVTSLTGYSMICLMRPHNGSRSGSFAARSAGGANLAQMIIDGGKWFGGGDFGAGYTGFTPVADHWVWAGLSHEPGSSVYRWHHKDVTAAGASVHGSSAFAVGNPGAIATIRLGDGDDEAQCDIALGAIYATDFVDDAAADAFFDSAFTLAAADAFGLGPLAMWLGDATNLETDATGDGADVTSTFGTVGNSTDPPGFNYALSSTVLLVGAATVGGITGAGALTRTVHMTGAGTVGGVTGAGALKRTVHLDGAGLIGGIAGTGALKRTVHLAGAALVGGITGHGSFGVAAVAGRRALIASRAPARIVSSGRATAIVTSSARRPA